MYGRNHSYDVLRQSLRDLSTQIPQQNNVFSKSSEENTLDVFEQYIQLNDEKETLGKTINKQFQDLKHDYEKEIINLKRYSEKLEDYRDFFNSEVVATDLPKSLNAQEILTEIAKYLG